MVTEHDSGTASPSHARGAHLAVRTAARLIAAVRRGPALHTRGVRFDGDLTMRPDDGAAWGVNWLDAPGRYPVTGRWSRALGLPDALPDGAGLALRTQDAQGRTVDLLMTTAGGGRLMRHVPRLRGAATAGPYSTLLGYRVGARTAVVAAFPVPGVRPVPATRRGFARAVSRRTLCFELRAAGPGGTWRTFAQLTVRPPADDTPVAFDPYLNFLPSFRPTPRLARLRMGAYAGSRRGRHAPAPR
ncbi:phosphodiesterase [Streptomyces sp. NPDC048111]|uniref:phosphodiesterase n=1 Tax=Streptomyces sp. NPDC048111 TaxID=3365500 RepID=UPI003724AC88